MKFDSGNLTIDNFLTGEECKGIIDYFKKTAHLGFAYPRMEPAHLKSDTSVSLIDGNTVTRNYKAQWQTFNFLTERMQNVFDAYRKEYSILMESDFQIFDIKIQKTEPSEGYHVWHDDGLDHKRATTFIIYLNDDFDGGETEFLYASKRIKPEEGKLFMFPSTYMWTHRGNPPLTGTKYILTGWIEYVN